MADLNPASLFPANNEWGQVNMGPAQYGAIQRERAYGGLEQMELQTQIAEQERQRKVLANEASRAAIPGTAAKQALDIASNRAALQRVPAESAALLDTAQYKPEMNRQAKVKGQLGIDKQQREADIAKRLKKSNSLVRTLYPAVTAHRAGDLVGSQALVKELIAELRALKIPEAQVKALEGLTPQQQMQQFGHILDNAGNTVSTLHAERAATLKHDRAMALQKSKNAGLVASAEASNVAKFLPKSQAQLEAAVKREWHAASDIEKENFPQDKKRMLQNAAVRDTIKAQGGQDDLRKRYREQAGKDINAVNESDKAAPKSMEPYLRGKPGEYLWKDKAAYIEDKVRHYNFNRVRRSNPILFKNAKAFDSPDPSRDVPAEATRVVDPSTGLLVPREGRLNAL